MNRDFFSRFRRNTSLGGLMIAVVSSFSLFLLALYRFNYPFISGLPLPPVLFFCLFILCLAALFIKARPSLDWRAGLLFLGIGAAVLLVKLPIILNMTGYLNSDDSIFGLMSRHFLDGRPTPLFFYGQHYLGSFYMVANALFFPLLGSTPLAMGLVALIFFSAFIFIQIRWLSRFLDRYTAYLCGAWYIVSGGILKKNIFSLGGNFPLVYLLTALIFLLTMKVLFGDEDHLVYWLGFIIGFGFWNHQIILVFGLVAVPALLIHKRLKLAVPLGLTLLLGILPFLFFEVSNGFINLKFTFLGGAQPGAATNFLAKLGNLKQGLLDLFPPQMPPVLVFLFYIPVLFFVARSLYRFFRSKKIEPETMLSFFLLAYLFVYLASQFSNTYTPRYFMPLCVLVPILWSRPFQWGGSRWLKLSPIPFLLLAGYFGVSDHLSYGRHLSRLEGYRMALFNRLQESDSKYWFTDTYPDSYIFSLLSGEEKIVTNGSLERYLPYLLSFYRQPDRNIYLVGRGGVFLKRKFDLYGIRHKYRKTRLFHFFENIEDQVNLVDWRRKPLPVFPQVSIGEIIEGRLGIEVDDESLPDPERQRLRLNVEIQGRHLLSRYREKLPPGGRIHHITIPPCFDGESVWITAYLDDSGFTVPVTGRRKYFDSVELDTEDSLFFLWGCSPAGESLTGSYRTRDRLMNNRVSFLGEEFRVLERRAELLIDRESAVGSKKLCFTLYNLVDFDRAVWRYLHLSQSVTIKLGDLRRRFRLKHGANFIELPLTGAASETVSKWIRVSFHTQYVLPFYFPELGYYETGAAVDRIVLK